MRRRLRWGGRIAAESALYDIRQAMGDREFSSVEEMNAFIQEYNQQRDRKPVDDFEGLSSEQVHRLINFPFESSEIVEFPPVISGRPSAPIATLFSMLLDAPPTIWRRNLSRRILRFRRS